MDVVVAKQQADDTGEHSVIAVGDLDELVMLAEPLQREPVTVDGALLRKPGDGARKPLMRGLELARVVGVPGERLRAPPPTAS